ncbi:beta-xylosidase [Streptomyces sp. FIT100]|uniref:beta-xylosidase n=1 Tax=Streptomyces sp. FIT100 TaxID=2837956 RepID=UPI0021C9785B|nr:beta-xylosidase [Streptomyces sp. FIT100]UUN26837.1 beta-xylosidase [Streptomyces sp. FIT100]
MAILGPPSRRSAGRRRRLAAVLGVTALAVTGGGLLAPPAAAMATASAAVDFPTHCIPPPIAGIPPIDGTTTAEITVDNAAPEVGDTVKVTYKVVKPAAGNPVDIDLPADIMTPTGKVTLTGAQTGSVTVTGPKKNPPVPGLAEFPPFEMTGTFTVTAPGEIKLSPGDYNIHTSFVLELDTPCTVTNPPAPVSETITATDGGGPVNERTITLSAASGKPGERVTVTGAKFTPSTDVTVAGWNGSAPTADKVTAKSTATGSLTFRPKINDPATVGIVAFEGASWDPAKGAGPAAYTLIGDVPPLSQQLGTMVRNGVLSMTQAGDSVQLSTVDFGTGGASTGALHTVTVKDFRGGPAGWSLTGRVTDLTGPGGAKIDAGKLSWTPSCTTKAGSPSTCAAGSPGAVGSAGATLASTPNGAFTGGEFTVDAGLSLDVPAFTPPGTYAGVLTLTLT